MSEQYTVDEAIASARKCGAHVACVLADEVERLRAANRDCIDWYESLKADYKRLRAALAAEREACAKVCDSMGDDFAKQHAFDHYECYPEGWVRSAHACAEAIRNRTERG